MANEIITSFPETSYPFRLYSANTSDEGWSIIRASEIGGHRTVATIEDLYKLTVPVLSETNGRDVNGNVTGTADAIGQLWYVQSEACFYQLVDWQNRKNINGWKKFSAGGGSQRVLPIDGVKESGPDTLLGLIKVDDTSAEDFTFSYPTASGAPVSESFDENYGIYFINKWSDPNSSNQGITITSTPHPALALKHTDGVFVFGHKDEIGDDSFNVNSGSEITTAPANLRLRHHYFTKFKNSNLYAYDENVEQIFLDPTGQAWKYDEDGLNLIKTDFVSAFTTKQDVQKIVDDEVAKLVDGAPAQLDTLKELAAAVTENGEILDAVVPNDRTITAGTGLTGGGDLTTNRTISIADGGVGTTQLADLAVTTGKINDLAVTTTKIAANAVTTEKVNDKAVTTAKINDKAVTTDKIADLAVTGDKISGWTITADKIDKDDLNLMYAHALPFGGFVSVSYDCATHGPDDTATETDIDSTFVPSHILYDVDRNHFCITNLESISLADDHDLTTSAPDQAATAVNGDFWMSFNLRSADGPTGPTTFTDDMYKLHHAYPVKYFYQRDAEKLWRFVYNADGEIQISDVDSNTANIAANTANIAANAAKVNKIESDVYAKQRTLPSISFLGNYTIKNLGGATVESGAVKTSYSLRGGQYVDFTDLQYKWTIPNKSGSTTPDTDTYQPYTAKTNSAGTALDTTGRWGDSFNTDATATTFTSSKISPSITASATSVGITLGASKVGLMVKDNKVVPATGYDVKSATISASWTYFISYGTLPSVPSDNAELAAAILKANSNSGNTLTDNKDKRTSSYVSKAANKTLTVKNNFGETGEQQKDPTYHCYYFYAYPKSWGALTKAVLDGATPVFNTFECRTVSITTNENFTEDYYVYVTTKPGGFTGGSVAFTK